MAGVRLAWLMIQIGWYSGDDILSNANYRASVYTSPLSKYLPDWEHSALVVSFLLSDKAVVN